MLLFERKKKQEIVIMVNINAEVMAVSNYNAVLVELAHQQHSLLSCGVTQSNYLSLGDFPIVIGCIVYRVNSVLLFFKKPKHREFHSNFFIPTTSDFEFQVLHVRGTKTAPFYMNSISRYVNIYIYHLFFCIKHDNYIHIKYT